MEGIEMIHILFLLAICDSGLALPQFKGIQSFGKTTKKTTKSAQSNIKIQGGVQLDKPNFILDPIAHEYTTMTLAPIASETSSITDLSNKTSTMQIYSTSTEILSASTNTSLPASLTEEISTSTAAKSNQISSSTKNTALPITLKYKSTTAKKAVTSTLADSKFISGAIGSNFNSKTSNQIKNSGKGNKKPGSSLAGNGGNMGSLIKPKTPKPNNQDSVSSGGNMQLDENIGLENQNSFETGGMPIPPPAFVPPFNSEFNVQDSNVDPANSGLNPILQPLILEDDTSSQETVVSGGGTQIDASPFDGSNTQNNNVKKPEISNEPPIKMKSKSTDSNNNTANNVLRSGGSIVDGQVKNSQENGINNSDMPPQIVDSDEKGQNDETQNDGHDVILKPLYPGSGSDTETIHPGLEQEGGLGLQEGSSDPGFLNGQLPNKVINGSVLGTQKDGSNPKSNQNILAYSTESNNPSSPSSPRKTTSMPSTSTTSPTTTIVSTTRTSTPPPSTPPSTTSTAKSIIKTKASSTVSTTANLLAVPVKKATKKPSDAFVITGETTKSNAKTTVAGNDKQVGKIKKTTTKKPAAKKDKKAEPKPTPAKQSQSKSNKQQIINNKKNNKSKQQNNARGG